MFIGVDIGGTKINAILFENGKILKQIKESTPKNKKDFFELLFRIVKELISKEVKSIGIGIAGALDIEKGRVLRSVNLSFLDGVYFKKKLEDKTDLPVRMDNDARCFLRGEALFGAAKGYQGAIGITLGTGIGGCILMNGKIISGAHDSAGEVGHMIIQAQSEKRKAQNAKICLSFEDLASQKGIKRLSDKTSEELAARAKKGDNKAKEIFDELGFYLGVGLANLVNILDPEVIIIGGGLLNAGQFILKPARAVMNQFILSPRAKKVQILLSKLGENAGAIGAASL